MPDLPPLHALHAPPVPLESACHAVVAHFSSDATQGRAFLDDVEDAVPLDCQIIVYDKSSSPCSFAHSERINDCRALDNVGREQHTYAYHLATHYDKLPATLILLTSDLTRHGRFGQMASLVDATMRRGAGFACVDSQNRVSTFRQTGLQRACSLDRYSRCTMECYANCGPYPNRPRVLPFPAQPRGLGAWFEATVANASAGARPLYGYPACHFGIASTTRDDLRAHPWRVYDAVARDLSVAVVPETAFYMEWAMSALFGARSSWAPSETRPQAASGGAACGLLECETALPIEPGHGGLAARAFQPE